MGLENAELVPIDFTREYEKSLEAQQTVLGSILISPEITGDVLSKASSDDFTGACKNIFIAIKQLFAENTAIDPVTILNKAGENYNKFLLELMQNTPTAANYKVYLEVLKEQSLLRHAREVGNRLTEALDADEARGLIDEASKLLTTARSNWKVYSTEDLLHLFFNKYNNVPEYIDWGIQKLNQRVHTDVGDFVVIGGRPSVGKTALAIEMAFSISQKKNVGFFSFETGPNKFIDRVVSMEFRVDLGAIKRRDLSQMDFARILNGSESFCAQNVRFIHANGMTAQDIQSVALAYKFDVIFVDYLQIVNSGLPKALSTEQVRAISIGLHNFAQCTGITVISLAQLKRAASKDDAEKAPTLSDLKESGQIEQDADVIMFLYRETPGQRNSPRRLAVAKNKEGECGTFTLNFEGKYQTFSSEGCSVDDVYDDNEMSEVEQTALTDYMPDDEKREFRSGRNVPIDERFRGKKT